ncbi:hypothetical protein V8C26DRAFT_228766 [Trichoderma gracile]
MRFPSRTPSDGDCVCTGLAPPPHCQHGTHAVDSYSALRSHPAEYLSSALSCSLSQRSTANMLTLSNGGRAPVVGNRQQARPEMHEAMLPACLSARSPARLSAWLPSRVASLSVWPLKANLLNGNHLTRKLPVHTHTHARTCTSRRALLRSSAQHERGRLLLVQINGCKRPCQPGSKASQVTGPASVQWVWVGKPHCRRLPPATKTAAVAASA